MRTKPDSVSHMTIDNNSHLVTVDMGRIMFNLKIRGWDQWDSIRITSNTL
jgi:hypothetical protein